MRPKNGENEIMWVFGYGSLMWDGWEVKRGCTKKEQATLQGYCRDFNKASVKYWGSSSTMCPTLGLVRSVDAVCVGTAFEFPDAQRDRITEYLREREGLDFDLVDKEILLNSGATVVARLPLNKPSAATFIGNMPLKERAALASVAKGSKGACLDYVKNIRNKLAELNISDTAVGQFGAAVSGQ